MSIRSALVVLLCLTAFTQAETSHQFGNLIYTVPDGFRKGRSDRGCVIIYSDSDRVGVFATIRVYVGVNKSDANGQSLKDWAMKLIETDLDDGEKVTRPADAKPTRVQNLPGLMISRLTSSRGNHMQIYTAAELPTRYELLRFDSPVRDKKEIAKTAEVARTAYLPFVEKVHAVSMGAKPLLGNPTPGELEGVWWGGGLQPMPGMGGAMQLTFITATYTFFKDGRFYAGVPEHGVSGFDFAAAAMLDAGKTGNYQIDNGKIHFDYADGETSDATLDGKVIRQGIKHLTLCRQPENGFTFEGTREFIFYQGFAPGTMQGGASAYNTSHFRKDGTFVYAGGGGASATFNQGGGFATGSNHDAQGTYVVKDGFVEMTDKTGKQVRRWTILLSDGQEDGKPKVSILVSGEFLK